MIIPLKNTTYAQWLKSSNLTYSACLSSTQTGIEFLFTNAHLIPFVSGWGLPARRSRTIVMCHSGAHTFSVAFLSQLLEATLLELCPVDKTQLDLDGGAGSYIVGRLADWCESTPHTDQVILGEMLLSTHNISHISTVTVTLSAHQGTDL